ncbi:hypothetical protein EDD18DRAFT_325265 [Armillaria luteobubalina]|uniref:Uncharacterized protein n=1 Tax=Armillaria luteobubalina TaxID=153913 RepID=A0AA39QLE8_9AGAR|nr:hypothetical protein EDD18DRAFT_325265 [Armillaria luteobubalina]
MPDLYAEALLRLSLMSGQLPPELVHAIISDFWYSEHSSSDRTLFMKTCPLINSLWKDVFACIASRDVFVPTNEYLFYLSSIIQNNDSLIYHLTRPPHPTRTITCHVDLVDSTEDAAQEPYTTLSALPNYIGFRKCFPNLTRLVLEIRYSIRRGFFCLILDHHQIIRTRLSITLDQATTHPGVLRIDWEITADDPEPEYIRGEYADSSWRMFLRDARRAMAPAALSNCIRATPLDVLLSHSTYMNRVMRFSSHSALTERPGDVRGVNRRFGKASRVVRPFSWWAFFEELYEDLTWMGDTVREYSNWDKLVPVPGQM